METQKGEGDILAVIQNPSNSENQLSALSPCMTQPEHAEQKTLLSTLPWLCYSTVFITSLDFSGIVLPKQMIGSFISETS